jgi:hypothetical protein
LEQKRRVSVSGKLRWPMGCDASSQRPWSVVPGGCWGSPVAWFGVSLRAELVLKRRDNPAEYADRRRHEHRGRVDRRCRPIKRRIVMSQRLCCGIA